MDPSPYDTGYTHVQHPQQASGIYGAMPGFDPTTLKYHHHGLYPDASTDAASATFYQNYMHSSLTTPQDYNHRDTPSYSESTIPSTASALFHPGFVSSAVDYYNKTGGMGGSAGVGVCTGGGLVSRSTDMISDYQGGIRNSATAMTTDNILMKQEGGGINNESGVGNFLQYGAGRYSEEDLHHLQHHHHHHHHQQQQQQQQQSTLHHLQQPLQQQQQQQVPAPKPPMQQMPSGELQQEDCKLEPDASHEFKTQNNLSMTPTAPVNPLQHHHHQIPEDQPDLPPPPPPPPHDVTESHAQSPCSDVTSGEGTEMTSQETDVNTSSELSQTQQEGNSAGNDSAQNSNEVKPTLSYIALIAKSILESHTKRLNLGSIYGWIEKKFPYYQNRGQGWRNSVRHNLSLNDCFIKAGRCEDGKGNYWAIHPANMQDFLRGDFRQRRRSRRRGRKKDCELGLYHHHQFSNGYLGAAAAAAGSSLGGVGTQMPAFSPSAAALYSPYTEAERRAYRLDEALLRQSMNSPFFKWYHHQSSAYAPTTSPSPVVNTGVYSGVGGVGSVSGVAASNSQWPQTYPENNNSQTVYPLNSSFSR
ncbi:hypothetical protein ACOMHN_022203 [Nucella lapillus]